jgi:hypothetical protein
LKILRFAHVTYVVSSEYLNSRITGLSSLTGFVSPAVANPVCKAAQSLNFASHHDLAIVDGDVPTELLSPLTADVSRQGPDLLPCFLPDHFQVVLLSRSFCPKTLNTMRQVMGMSDSSSEGLRIPYGLKFVELSYSDSAPVFARFLDEPGGPVSFGIYCTGLATMPTMLDVEILRDRVETNAGAFDVALVRCDEVWVEFIERVARCG